jgi:hypothetical protein
VCPGGGVEPVRRRWVIALVIAAGFFGGLVVAALVLAPRAEDVLREKLVDLLEERFDSTVELRKLHVSLFPRIHVTGEDLVLRRRNQPGAAPLIQLDRFIAETDWSGAMARPRKVHAVTVQGLRITITPSSSDGIRDDEHGGCRGDRRHVLNDPGTTTSPVYVETLRAPGTELELLPRNKKKRPRRFSIHDLTMHGLTVDRPFDYDAQLTNPTPRGTIQARGQFGPWATNDPGLSPVSGRYTFDDADLATINGLGGILRSTGAFNGVLEQILVHGETTTPDFALTTGGAAIPLNTRFDACVDGSDGDTYLDRVNATLGSTPIDARGRIEGTVGVHGRTVALEVRIEKGRIEDVLRLAVKGPPLMKGALSLDARLMLPPGAGPVVRRLELDGQFGLTGTQFTGKALQSKINEFSRRGRGDVENPTPASVASNLRGRFALANGVMRLPSLNFAVPGAELRLAGRYGLESEALAFQGTVRLQAKVSETTTGVKSLLLKIVDPFFSRKGAGTVLPIHITGTREQPKFGVDVKRALLRKDK